MLCATCALAVANVPHTDSSMYTINEKDTYHENIAHTAVLAPQFANGDPTWAFSSNPQHGNQFMLRGQPYAPIPSYHRVYQPPSPGIPAVTPGIVIDEATRRFGPGIFEYKPKERELMIRHRQNQRKLDPETKRLLQARPPPVDVREVDEATMTFMGRPPPRPQRRPTITKPTLPPPKTYEDIPGYARPTQSRPISAVRKPFPKTKQPQPLHENFRRNPLAKPLLLQNEKPTGKRPNKTTTGNAISDSTDKSKSGNKKTTERLRRHAEARANAATNNPNQPPRRTEKQNALIERLSASSQKQA